MQSVRSRIWTRVAVSIFCDDNHYTTGTSIKKVGDTQQLCNTNNLILHQSFVCIIYMKIIKIYIVWKMYRYRNFILLRLKWAINESFTSFKANFLIPTGFPLFIAHVQFRNFYNLIFHCPSQSIIFWLIVSYLLPYNIHLFCCVLSILLLT